MMRCDNPAFGKQEATSAADLQSALDIAWGFSYCTHSI